MMDIQSLTKVFGAHTVVDNISFTLVPHTITALIGPNGAGKTTTLSMLAGLLPPTSGHIHVEDPTPLQQQIGFLPQYPKFFEWMTAFEYVEMMGKLSGFTNIEAMQRAHEVLEYVGLLDAKTKRIDGFSGGMKQRLGIAQAILHRPKLLILDEPVSALDPLGRKTMMHLLQDLQQTTTILYSTHILHDAEFLAEHVLFMKDGRLVEQGTLAAIQQKFEAPHIIITFTQADEARQFASQSTMPITVNERRAIIDVQQGKPTMQYVLQHLAQSPFDVEKIEHARLTLEEIFVKVVGQDA